MAEELKECTFSATWRGNAPGAPPAVAFAIRNAVTVASTNPAEGRL